MNLYEEDLEKIAASMLEMQKFDPVIFREQIDHINIDLDGTLEFHFTDGRRKTCKYEKSL